MIIEEILLRYLNTVLAAPVYMEVPEHPPDSYVVLEKTGGDRENHLARATIAAQSYAPSLYEAALLNTAVKAAFFSAGEELNELSAVDLNGDYNYTDPETKRYRYQAVFEIYHYEEV